MGKQDGGDDSSDIKEDLRREQDAREMNTELQLLGREAVEHPAGELRGEDFGYDGAGDEHRGHHSDDDGESLLGVVLALLRQKAGVDGDESDRGGAAGDDVVEPVGQGEGGYVGVGLLSGAESVGDVGLADVSDHARERDGRHQQQRRRKRGVLVRGTKKAQQTHLWQINASGGWWQSYRGGENRGRQLVIAESAGSGRDGRSGPHAIIRW